jgi:hypothetical protein
MAVGEIYLKLTTRYPDDPKVRALARFGAPDAGLARDLYVQMCLHCKENLTDGFVAAEQVGILVYPLDPEHGNQLAKQLASVGLTKEATKEEATGWQVLAYLPRNGTKEDVERLSKVRSEAGRTGGHKSRKRPAQRKPRAKGSQVANQLDLQNGSNADSVSDSVKTTESETDIQTPTESAALTITQRSKRLTDAYAAAEPMCNWPAVNGVVIKAIKSEKFADEEITAALLRMAKEGRGVTVETLRVELVGLPPRNPSQQLTTGQNASQSTGGDRARGARTAGQNVQNMIDRGELTL